MSRKVLFVLGNFVRSHKFRELDLLSSIRRKYSVDVAVTSPPMKLSWPLEEHPDLREALGDIKLYTIESPRDLAKLQTGNGYSLILLCSHGALTPHIRKLSRLSARVVVIETYGGFDLVCSYADAVIAKSDFSYRVSRARKNFWSPMPKSSVAIGPLYLRRKATSEEFEKIETAVFLKSISAYRRKSLLWLGAKYGKSESEKHEKITKLLLQRLLERGRPFKIFQHPGSRSEEIEFDTEFFASVGLTPEVHLTLDSCTQYSFDLGIGLNTTSCFDVNWLGKPFIFLQEAQKLYRHKSWDFAPQSQLLGPSSHGYYQGITQNKFVPAWHGLMSNLTHIDADINLAIHPLMQNEEKAKAYGQYFFGPAEPPYELLEALWDSIIP